MSVNQDNEIKFNFKAWIAPKTPGEAGAYKLHVHGHIEVADETLLYQLDKKELQGYFHEELMLVVKPDPVPGNNKVEIKYHEDIGERSEYKKVTISANNEQIIEINEITEETN